MGTAFNRFLAGVMIFTIVLLLQWPTLFWTVFLFLPFILIGLYDRFQTHDTLRRNFPLFGRGRWIMESLRPYIRQYFVESDTDGLPINRMFRSVVYQRAKNELETVPFGTKVDTYKSGYEWMGHSLSAIDVNEVDDLRIRVGSAACRKPYHASIFNISAMSFGALSPNAILALNLGAKLGGFLHNTGEGGISPYHLRHGGDLVWQIGTGYFGCRDHEGRFSPEIFKHKAALESVRLIELKLSQGAKPGHGGILPAEKNSEEIAAIRGVAPWTQIISPSTHSAFDSPIGLLRFLALLRDLSGGKPVGFKLAIGRPSEFVAICKAMTETGILPDFITVDGGEGGTGAAPLEYTNSVGMPLREGLALVADCLTGFGLRNEIRLIATGKILTGFHLIKHLALGADIGCSARGMMLALGCVHSLTCNSNRCPSGVATQDPHLARGLVVEDKSKRVFHYHAKTIQATAELLSSAGLRHTAQLNRTHIHRRISPLEAMRYDQLFPYIKPGSLLTEETGEPFSLYLKESCSARFMPEQCITCIDQAHMGISTSQQPYSVTSKMTSKD